MSGGGGNHSPELKCPPEPYQELKFEILLHILKDKRVEYFQVKTRRTNL